MCLSFINRFNFLFNIMTAYLNSTGKGTTDGDISKLIKQNFSSLKAEEFLIFSFGFQSTTALDVNEM